VWKFEHPKIAPGRHFAAGPRAVEAVFTGVTPWPIRCPQLPGVARPTVSLSSDPMSNFESPNTSTESRRRPATPAAVLRRLIEPAVALSEPERRRSRVLAILILTLVVSAALFWVVVVIGPETGLRGPYALLIGALLLLFAIAFGLNHTGHYSAAAGLIVACTILGPWVSIALNLNSLSSDVMRLSYIAVSVLLCSFLLPTRVTFFVAVSQLAVLLLLSLSRPVLTYTSWPSLLGFILFMSVLSVVSNAISRRDLDQIDRQTRQLVESEARLRDLSVRDPLTGLFNRRYLEETLERELNRAARKQLPLGIIMVDIDHFKQFNDAHGHSAGDALLQQVGRMLREHIRGADIACRYGGEEFTLILPDASRDVIRQRAEHMREDARQLHVRREGQALEAVTLSLGIAVFPEHGSTGAAVLGAADAALYRAKHEGRDRVVVADE
jgi:diguanylate cyclase (GGDEF)-like protein